jgi:chemotaxis response regulator CheB
MSPPIRIALLDDHTAVRAGLRAIIASEPDLELVGAAASEAELWPLLRTTHPDLVLLDLHHPGRDGLSLALQIKRPPDAPAVVLYSAFIDDVLVVAAALAGAGGGQQVKFHCLLAGSDSGARPQPVQPAADLAAHAARGGGQARPRRSPDPRDAPRRRPAGGDRPHAAAAAPRDRGAHRRNHRPTRADRERWLM